MIYEFSAKTRSDAKIDEAPYLHAAMRLGAEIVSDLVRERKFAYIKIRPSAYGCDKITVDETATYFLTRSRYLPSTKVLLFTEEGQKILILAGVYGQNSPQGLEGKVVMAGDEAFLSKFESLKRREPRVRQ